MTRQRTFLTATLIWTYAAAALSSGMIPVVVSTLAKSGLPPTILGLIGFLEYGSSALAAMIASSRLKSSNPANFAIAGSVAAILGSLGSSLLVDATVALFAMRLIVGFGEGVMIAGVLSAAARTEKPGRIYSAGAFVFAGVATGGFYLTPHLVAATGGASGIFLFHATLITTALVANLLVRSDLSQVAQPCSVPDAPSQKEESRREGTSTAVDSIALLIGVAAMLLWAIGEHAIFSFSTLIGVSAGVSLETIGTLLLIAVVAGSVMAPVAARVGEKVGMLVPVTAILSIGVVSAILIVGGQAISFSAGLCLSVVSSLVFVPTLQGMFAMADPTGRLVTTATAAKQIGLALGPLVGGFIIEFSQSDFVSLGLFSATLYVLSFLMIVGVIRRLRWQAAAARLQSA